MRRMEPSVLHWPMANELRQDAPSAISEVKIARTRSWSFLWLLASCIAFQIRIGAICLISKRR